MKIVHVLLSPRIGGAEQMVAGLNQEFTLRGIDSRVIYLDSSSAKNGRIKRLNHLWAELRQVQADAVLAHSFLPGLYARLASPIKSKVHYVLHSASDDYQHLHTQWIERILLSRTSSIIAVDSRQLDVYKAHFTKIFRSTTIENGVSKMFLSEILPKAYPHKVVTVARVAAQKRPHFWVEVAKLAQMEGLDLRFEWWGPLSGEEDVDRFVLNNLPKNAHYMGPTLNPEKVLGTSDIVFQSSNREAGSSLSVLEAAVSGKPQICSDSIALSQDFDESVVRYREKDPQSALDSIKSICSDWEKSSESAFNESTKIFEKFGMEAVAQRYLDWLALFD